MAYYPYAQELICDLIFARARRREAARQAAARAGQIYSQLLQKHLDLKQDGTPKKLQYFRLSDFSFFADLEKSNFSVTNFSNGKTASSYGNGKFPDIFQDLIQKTI